MCNKFVQQICAPRSLKDFICNHLDDTTLNLYNGFTITAFSRRHPYRLSNTSTIRIQNNPIYPTPPLGQDMTQGQFLSGV